MNKRGENPNAWIQNFYGSTAPPTKYFNMFPFDPPPGSWSSAPRVRSVGILLIEMNWHHLTLFIPNTALSLVLPLFQSPGFPQNPLFVLSLSIFASSTSFFQPSCCPPSQVCALLSTPILGTMKLFWLTVWPVE